MAMLSGISVAKNNLICIKGPVEKTLDIKENLPNKISILRIQISL